MRYSFLCLLLSATSGWAAITLDGVADKKVYADRVSFVVHSAQGFATTAQLNGQPVAVGTSVEVNEPQYYELAVNQRNLSSGAQQNQLVRFIVRASQRADTEWGLPMWTPYPPIDSASAEFAGATLQVIAPAGYPTGLEIPVIARVQDSLGNRLGVNGTVTAAGFESHPLQLFRGVGSVFLPAAAQAGTIGYTTKVRSLQTPKSIVIESATTWQTVSGDLASSVNWGPNARIRIRNVANNLLTIKSGVTLTIGAGSVVLIDPGITISVQGKIVVNGSLQQPVVFTAPDRTKPWGGFLFESSASQGDFTGTILTASGADASWFSHNPGHGRNHLPDQCLLYLSNGAHATLTDSFIIENRGQAGHGEKGYLTMTRCLIQKCVTGGQYNDGAVTAKDSAFIETPSATAPFVDGDNDAFYLSGGAHSFTNCLVGWTLDDGIDAGDGPEGTVTFDHCWIESCTHEGLALSSGPRHVKVTNTVILNCGQGIEAGYGTPLVDADQCLCTANLVGARFGDNYNWTYSGFLDVKNSLLLFNWRDVWGMAFDTWTVHLSQMDIQNNYLSVPNTGFPNNRIWDPNADPNQLVPFLPTLAETVGIGLAVRKDVFDLSELPNEIPVRLSAFTTKAVSVNYSIDGENGPLDGGTLHFVAGESLKFIAIDPAAAQTFHRVQVTLSNPVNAELTGYSTVTYQGTVVERLIVKGDLWRYFIFIPELFATSP
jgi:hypothetical protein